MTDSTDTDQTTEHSSVTGAPSPSQSGTAPADAVPAKKKQESYPLSQRFSIHYSALEDRLVLRATYRDEKQVVVLLTRRMVLLVLQQVLSRIPALAALEKTPREFWAEVLQIGHQQAMQDKAAADAKAAPARKAAADAARQPPSANGDAERSTTSTDMSPREPIQDPVYLATDLMVGGATKGLTLAYKGLRMPGAMIEPSKAEPIVAIPMEVSHLHQLIHLVVAQSRRAEWHLPLDLPWIEAPDDKVPDTVITH